MRKRFVACIECSRHVREGDEACPFCGARAPALPPPPRAMTTRVSRAAMLAAGAAGGIIVLVDCGDGNTSPQPFYGVACTDDSCLGETDASDSSLVLADARVVDAADAADSPNDTASRDGTDAEPSDGGATDAAVDGQAGDL
jgi:hypothetical protein